MSKCQRPSFNLFRRRGDLKIIGVDYNFNKLVICKTALATPGLLKWNGNTALK